MTLKELSDHLQQILESGACQDLLELKSWLNEIDVEGWSDMVHFQDERYCRNIISHSTLFDLVIICWKPGQGSPIHDHPEKGCLVRVLRGVIGDELQGPDGEITRNQYSEGEVLYINNDMGKHQVFNNSQANAVSLHIYAPGEYEPQ